MDASLIKYVVIGVVAVLLIILISMGYVKAPPDNAYIISGLRKKTIIGKSSIRIPFFERLDKLELQLISVDVKTATAVPTSDYINIRVDANVNVKISIKPELLALAAQNFLNKDTTYICETARRVLEGNIREIVGQMTLTDMVNNRKGFSDKVRDNAAPDLEKMGLDIISFNVQNFSDDQNLIDNLGMDNTSKIKKDAAIAKAVSEKEVAVAEAKAAKEANDAKVEAETEIAQKQNELAIKQAQLKKDADTQKAIADAAYEIQKEEQRKTIEITSAEANIAKTQKEIEIKAQEAKVTEQALEAEIKKKADADKYRVQQESDAKLYETQKKAEAELFEVQKKAEADKYQREQDAEAQMKQAEARKFAKLQDAEGVRAVGEAEAEAIRAKALAEAEGIDAKAEAMKKYGEAAVLEMYFKALPEIVRNAASPLSQVDKITMYGDGNSSKLVGDIIGSTTKITDGLSEALGIDVKSVLIGALGEKFITKPPTPPAPPAPPAPQVIPPVDIPPTMPVTASNPKAQSGSSKGRNKGVSKNKPEDGTDKAE